MSPTTRDRPVRLDELTVHAGRLRARVAPALGGKITGLRFGEAGRQWLAPPIRPLAFPSPGQDWGELDCSGWDECLPNIAASADGALADHGDVWRSPWQWGPGALSGSVVPPGKDYQFAREVSVDDRALRIDYNLQNLGHAPLRWAWAQHMLLTADEQTRIVASAPMRLRLDSAFADGAASNDIGWLRPGTELHGSPGRAAKLWFEPPLPAVVAAVDGDDWLAWRIAESSCPDLGLWLNLGGWGGQELRHVAIEPAFGAHDRPADAYPRLEPLRRGGRRDWHVLIEAGTGLDRLNDLLTSGVEITKEHYL